MWIIIVSFIIPGLVGTQNAFIQCDDYQCVQDVIDAAEDEPWEYRVRVWPADKAFTSGIQTVRPLVDRQKI